MQLDSNLLPILLNFSVYFKFGHCQKIEEDVMVKFVARESSTCLSTQTSDLEELTPQQVKTFKRLPYLR